MPVTDTSIAAHTATRDQRLTQGARIMAALRGIALTDPELVAVTGIRLSSVNGARNALIERGLVRDSGRRVTNPESGLSNILWEAV